MRIVDPAAPLVAGFSDTTILPSKGRVQPVEVLVAEARIPLLRVPPQPGQPPEKGWIRSQGDLPMAVVSHAGRVVYFPGELEEMYARFRMPDHRRLLGNAVRSVGGQAVEGNLPPVVEVNLTRAEKGVMLLGLVNHSGQRLGCQALPIQGIRLKIAGLLPQTVRSTTGAACRVEKDGTIGLDLLGESDLLILETEIRS